MSDEPVILDGAEIAELRQGNVAGGEFVAYTCRAPDKATTSPSSSK